TPDFATLASVSKDLRDRVEVTYVVDRAGQTLTFQGPNPVPPLVKSVAIGSAAEEAGVLPGDLFVTIGDKVIAGFDQMPALVEASGGQPVDITLLRGTEKLALTMTPRRVDLPNADGGFDTRWLIGVTGGALFDPVRRTPGLIEAVKISAQQSWYMAKTNLNGIVQIIKGTISTCNLSGPIGMAKVASAAVQSGLEAFIGTLALMSLTIGIANLLPIPVLDGGHLVFHIYEAVFRRPPNERVMQVLMTAGLAILLSLMLFAFSNDLFLCA
ncbi:MAG: RIP metalloprotease, partial [Candidatus Saccharibacteria bacterium]|nr:RIP metalloprotease [Pseudorhodobacter sp.]